MRLDLDGLAGASREALMSEWREVVGRPRWCQTNRLKHHKPWERAFYEAIRERHSVRAASRFSLKVLRVDSDLCELK